MKLEKLCLCCVLAIGLTAGLPAGGVKESPAAAKESAPAAPAKVELSYWGWGPHVTAINEEIGPAFSKLHPEVTVKAVSMGPYELMDKFYVAMVSGKGAPDGVQLIRRISAKYLISELLYDFTDFVKAREKDFVDSLTRDVTSVDGRILAIALDYGPSVIFYNKELADRVGVDVKKIITWDDYLDVAKRVGAANPSIFIQPLYYPAGAWGSNYWRLWAQSAGANIFDENNKVIRNNAKIKEVNRFFYKLHTETNVIKAPVNDPSIYDALRDGKILFWPKNSYESGQMAQQVKTMQGKILAMPWPLWGKDAPKTTGNWGGVALVVPKKGKNAEMAAEFMKFFAINEQALVSLWFTTSGVPAFKPVREKILTIKDKQPFVANLMEAITPREVAAWNFTDWAQTEKILGDALDSMMAKTKTPDEAWDWAERQLINILGR